MLQEILKNKKNQPVATLLAKKKGETIKVGWSYHSDAPTWNEEYGDDVANVRLTETHADFSNGTASNLPHIVSKHISKFAKRAERYFKWVDSGEKRKA